jgi:hypothetical protein
MKKQLLIVLTSLIFASSMNASQGIGKDSYFNSRIGKKLKRVKPVGFGSFRLLVLAKKDKQKEVFIDWRRLYWGKLSDLLCSEEETYTDDIQKKHK